MDTHSFIITICFPFHLIHVLKKMLEEQSEFHLAIRMGLHLKALKIISSKVLVITQEINLQGH